MYSKCNCFVQYWIQHTQPLVLIILAFSTLFVNRHYLVCALFAADSLACHSRTNTISTTLSSSKRLSNSWVWFALNDSEFSFSIKVIWCICTSICKRQNNKFSMHLKFPMSQNINRLKIKIVLSTFFKCLKHAALLSHSVIYLLTVPCCAEFHLYIVADISASTLIYSYLYTDSS